MSIEYNEPYFYDGPKFPEPTFLRVVRVSVDPVVLIYDAWDKLIYSFSPDDSSQAEALARVIQKELAEYS